MMKLVAGKTRVSGGSGDQRWTGNGRRVVASTATTGGNWAMRGLQQAVGGRREVHLVKGVLHAFHIFTPIYARNLSTSAWIPTQ